MLSADGDDGGVGGVGIKLSLVINNYASSYAADADNDEEKMYHIMKYSYY